MSYATDHPDKCVRTGCPSQIPGSRWHRQRAQAEGWFFGKDGGIYCPEHVPDWVPGWRDRKVSGS